MIDLKAVNFHNVWTRMALPHSGSNEKSSRWFHSDNPETYAARGNKEFGLDDIFYCFNSLGYRTKEFAEIDHGAFKIMLLGCSVTLGVGLPIEVTYGEFLAQLIRDKYHIPVEVINLGMGARSVDFITRVLFQSLPVLRPHYVFCLMPDLSRREYVHYRDDMIMADYFGIYTNIENTEPHDEAFLTLHSDEWDFFSLVKNLSFIELILRDQRWSWDTWGGFFWQWREQRDVWSQYFDTKHYRMQQMRGDDERRGRARDNMHWGVAYHRYVAQDLFSHIELRNAVADYLKVSAVPCDLVGRTVGNVSE